MKIRAIILAAGMGTRMRSNRPKVLHSLLGKPLVIYAVDLAQAVTGEKPVVIVGYHAQQVKEILGDNADTVLQKPQLGTGHAVQQAQQILEGETDFVLITAADMPLFTEETFNRLIETQKSNKGPITMLTVYSDNPRGFGRVVKDKNGQVKAIVEEAQATPEQLEIHELNAGVYRIDADWLWGALSRIQLSSKGEYYLTDIVGIAVSDGLAVDAIPLEDYTEAIGINTRVHLAEAESVLRERINRNWMLAGVTIIDPNTTYIETDAVIGRDTILYPNTFIQGETRIGEACEIGPNSILRDTQVGDRCKILASMLEKAILENDVDMGPFAHLRSGAHLAEHVHMGNFGEVKNSYLGKGTKMGHFSYIGDATIGENVNIGAGTITCNFDGKQKNHTEIADNVFIGSDTMLVAPLNLGEGSITGAGSVVTKNVKPHTLVAGVPARAIRKLEEK